MTAAWMAADWPAPAGVIAGTTLRSGSPGELPVPGEPAWLNQVHDNVVVEAVPGAPVPDADASWSRTPGRLCVVRTADCLPVLFCAMDGSEVAAAHAGWRGLAAGVLEATVGALQSRPIDLLAWLGPAISPPAFEVGDEVREAFLAVSRGAASCFEQNPRGRWQADLYGLARQRLAAVGVTRVTGGGRCTWGDPERFYSYRRDRATGRMLSFVGIVKTP
jgi:YfiH family protein